MNESHYLGDGLYASYDGFQVTLSTARKSSEHFVCLDSTVLGAFIEYLRGLGFVIPAENDSGKIRDLEFEQ